MYNTDLLPQEVVEYDGFKYMMEGFQLKTTSKEASALDLIRKRFLTFKQNYKFWKISSPSVETGNIWVELNESQVIFDFYVKCPDCGKSQKMVFENIKWPEGSSADPRKVESDRLAYYECENENCDSTWDDLKRDEAVQGGIWKSRDKEMDLFKYLDTFRPQRIGFHIPAWISPFISLSESAAAFLKGLKSKEALRDFMNGDNNFIKFHEVPTLY